MLAEACPGERHLVLGNFDGVHRGHRVLIEHAVALAQRSGGVSSALVLEPHPQELLNPLGAPKLLTLPPERERLLREMGLQEIVVASYDASFSNYDAHAFVEEVLVAKLGARSVSVGTSYLFGKGASGDVNKLREMSKKLGFAVHPLTLYCLEGVVVSSSTIRQALLRGDLQHALDLLGHEWRIIGQVVHGDGRGRTIGFPTANLSISSRAQLPKHGVYTGTASWSGGEHPALIYIGDRPTVGIGTVRVEAHLLGFSGELYGEELALDIQHYLREETRFANLEELKEQIAKDIMQCQSKAGV